MVFISKELLVKWQEYFETKSIETICIELLTSKRKWCIIFTDRQPKYKIFFQELLKTICQTINIDNVFVTGDLIKLGELY